MNTYVCLDLHKFTNILFTSKEQQRKSPFQSDELLNQ